MLKTAWIKPSAFVVPYGTMSAVELDLTDIMDKLVVDDWGQCATGQLGSLRAHVEAGKLSATTLHAELGQIVAGIKPGRERDDETILLWHRGLSLSDIALGAGDAREGGGARHRPDAAPTRERGHAHPRRERADVLGRGALGSRLDDAPRVRRGRGARAARARRARARCTARGPVAARTISGAR
jgi:hypothetical protein